MGMKPKLRDFLRDEEGAGTVFAMSMAVCCIVIGGLAVDASNAWQMKQRLQATADTAAHAGVIMLAFPDATGLRTVESEAIEVALANMPSGRFGNVLVENDIEIGAWNHQTGEMNTFATVPSAVRVTTRLDGNASVVVPTFLLRLAGFTNWTMSTSAVFQLDLPACHYDGLIAGGIVDLTSNNEFRNNICVHGEQGVTLRSGNYFSDGTIISMPDSSLKADGGMFDPKGNNNIGMWEALTEASLPPQLATPEMIASLIADLSNPNSGIHSAITNPVVNNVTLSNQNSFDMSMLQENAVNVFTCGQGSASSIQIPGNATVANMVVVANCPIQFVQGSAVENAAFATTSTDANSFKGANGVRLGQMDNCAPGGGSQFITLGGVDFAASMGYQGSQVIALGDVKLAAGVQGLGGISVQAGGDITVTANNEFGLCSGGVDHIAHQYIFRMVN